MEKKNKGNLSVAIGLFQSQVKIVDTICYERIANILARNKPPIYVGDSIYTYLSISLKEKI